MDWIWRARSVSDWSEHSITDLARWEQRPFTPGVEHGPGPHDKRDNHERVLGSERPGSAEVNGIARRVADAILRFDIFPPDLLAGVVRRTPIEVGDTVGLRYHFLPGLDLFFAARVIERFEKEADGQWRCGFTYRTLQGHPACGEETFVVEKNLATGKVTAALRSVAAGDLARSAHVSAREALATPCRRRGSRSSRNDRESRRAQRDFPAGAFVLAAPQSADRLAAE